MRLKITSRSLIIYIILFSIFLLLIISNSFLYIRYSMSDRLYGGKQALNNIIIVKIDDQSINKVGRWPWNRDVFSELLLKVKDAKVIGVDVSFFEKSNNDSSLKETLSSLDNVVLAAEINENILFKPIFDTDFGYVNLHTDSNGITRSVKYGLLEMESEEDILPFAFQIYEKYKGIETEKREFEEGAYLINYVSGPGSFNSIGFYEVLQDQEMDFKDKIVLIGATAPNLHDNYFVPTSKGVAMSGVEIHANIIQNLILDNFLKQQGKLSIIILFIFFSFLGFFIFSKLKIYYLLAIIISIILSYIFLGIYLFNNSNYLLGFFFFPISLIVFTGAGIGVNYLEEKKHSTYLTEAFGRYVSKDLLSEIINKKHQLKLGGDKREITVFFSDIRQFTSISEKLKPEELVNLINEYFTVMTKIILENKGTLDKFIGDAIMAFWNAPFLEKEHAKLACKSAIEQIKSLKKLQKSFQDKNLPKIKIGCGINTGEAIIGNMGSEDRFDYTAIGDTVNLSSRLEGLTKLYGVDIIISESTKKLISDSEFDFRELDIVKVKGKEIPIKIYELCTDFNGNYKKFVEQYEKALSLYLNSKFKEAKKKFESALNLNKDDVAAKLFIERCKEYIKNPPRKDWEGSSEIKTK